MKLVRALVVAALCLFGVGHAEAGQSSLNASAFELFHIGNAKALHSDAETRTAWWQSVAQQSVASAAPGTLTATLTDKAEDPAGCTTCDWAAKAFAIGSDDASRVMVIGVISRASTNPSVSSITACGGSPTQVSTVLASGGVSRLIFYQIACPTGTTSTVSVQYTAAQLRAQAIVWTITNTAGTPVGVPAAGQIASNAAAGTTATTPSLTVNSGGITLLIGHGLNASAPTVTPTNYTVEAAMTPPVNIGSTTYSTAGRDTTTGSRAYTSTWSGGTTLATLLATSWSP